MANYEFTGEEKTIKIGHKEKVLKRIKYNSCLGGWIEKPENVQDNARVFDNACVFGNAVVKDRAIVSGNARVSENAIVQDSAVIQDGSRICGKAVVSGRSYIVGKSKVYGNAIVSGSAQLNDTQVFGKAKVLNGYFYDCVLSGDVEIDVRRLIRIDNVDLYNAEIIQEPPIVVRGLGWSITITDTMLHIGCQHFTFQEWLTNPDIVKRDLNFFEQYGPIISALCHSRLVKILRG